MNFDFNIDAEENCFFDTDPIYAFPKLKERLNSMCFHIGMVEAWRSVGTVDVLPEDIGERILFEDGGIFYIDDEGVKHRGFMYKTQFYFEWKGQTNKPKCHAYYCTAIENFGRNAYRFTNAEPIKVYSRNAHKEVEIKGMELCGYCKRMFMDKEAMHVKISHEFVVFVKNAVFVVERSLCDVDIFGYVKNWEEISLAYRTKKNFTCERCGTHVENSFDHFYMQTHHKNGVKTDNREGNLECLCIKCHSEVDEVHKRNFSSRASRLTINEYIQKYGTVQNFV